MDRALDDVVRERHASRNRNSSGRRNQRGGVRKPRNNGPSYDDSRLWVHDKFEDDDAVDAGVRIRGGARDTARDKIPPGGAKIRVDNIHYDLSEDDLLDLFRRQGPVHKLQLLYDRAGRSEGTAFVIYTHEEDAHGAIREFDGANAKGQPITLTLVGRGADATADAPRRNRSRSPGKSLFERIASPEAERDHRRDPTRKPTPPGIDRYVPPDRRRGRDGAERERSERRPAGRRGERGGERRRGEGRGERGERKPRGGNLRPKKTVEELDAEMNDYFGGGEQQQGEGAAEAAPAQHVQNTTGAVDEDEEMVL